MAVKKLSSRGLRVVLFGTPGSGKSSLLGALWQAAQSQEALLGGKIDDASGGLAELHNYVYEQKPEGNDDDLALYPISVSNNGQSLDATLIDCDGEVAQECLAKSQAALDSRSEGCKALLGADAILLVVDPTAGTAQIDKEFQQFGNFIHLLEKHRSQRNEVVGLPIYLVLTKCDAIAKPSDAGSAWLTKIEEGKKRVDKRFQEFLAKYPYRAELPFGKVDLHVWATSVKRPALADRSAKSEEPYGVAELFRRCFQSASEYHHRRQKARSRLNIALFGYGSLIAIMACAAAFFFAIRPDVELTTLTNEINETLPAEHKDWLKEPPRFEERLQKLAHIEENASFKKIPFDLQQKVKEAEVEIKKYKELSDVMLTIPLPKSARSEDSLQQIEESLDRIKMPQAYDEAWQQTKLLKKKQQYAQDVASYRKAAGEYEVWLDKEVKHSYDLIKRGNFLQNKEVLEATKDKGLLTRTANETDRKKWLKEAEDFLSPKHRFKDSTEFIPGSTTIAYGDVVSKFQSKEIIEYREKLNNNRSNLTLVRDAVEKLNFSS
jgi:GTPase SAR1 family protein